MLDFYKGVLLVLLSAAGFGLMPIFAVHAYDGGANVPTLLFVRFFSTTVFFFAFLFFFKRDVFPKLNIRFKQVASLFLLGGVLYTMQSLFYFSSIQYIPAAVAALLLYLYPVFVAILAYFFEKERFTPRVALSIVLSLAGLIIVLGSPLESLNAKGAIFALAAAITYSGYILFGNRVVAEIPPLVTSAFITLFASLSMLVTGAGTQSLDLNLTTSAWWAIAGVSFFSTVVAIMAFFAGMKLIGSTRASIVSTLEPIITSLFAFLLWGESLTGGQMIGGAIVLSGAVLVVLQKKTPKPDQKEC